MQRISVPLPQEAYEALRLRAFHEHQSLALTACKLLCRALDSGGRVADAPAQGRTALPLTATRATRQERAEDAPVIASKPSPAVTHTTAPEREFKPDFKK